MGFMEKNINIFLLILLLAMIVVLGGASVYYQDIIKETTLKFKEKNAEFDTCTTNLNNTTIILNKAKENLDLTKQDVSTYGVLYENKTAELTDTKTNLESTKSSLENTQSELSNTKETLDEFKEKYEKEKSLRLEVESENADLSETLKITKSAKAAADATIADLNDQIDALDNEVAQLEEECDA
ncbi:hypothetical protein HN587_03655 [Candidatus Woesearchaeota archaeon]|jgi:chromosome segregation ATPase|nr:hypothetical protein [Candidatus Woesearchaeota archaeon]